MFIESDEVVYSRFLEKQNENDLRILLERHRESLILFLHGFVHNMEDAEELMLDAFAEVAAGAGFLGKSSFRTWLFAIGKKKALMLLRKHRAKYREQDFQLANQDDPPELEILKAERNLQIYQALERLKDEYRQVLILLYFEEMSHEEAARVMGKNRKQIYNLAERGRKALKGELERMGFEDAQYG